MISQKLEVALHMAFVEARQQRHEFIAIEHLLLALLDNPSAGEVLRGCGADLTAMRKELTSFITENHPRLPGEEEVDTQPTLGFQRVIQRAIMSVQRSGNRKREVQGSDVLAGIFSEKDSFAVRCLHQHGISTEDVANVTAFGRSGPGIEPVVWPEAEDADNDGRNEADTGAEVEPADTTEAASPAESAEQAKPQATEMIAHDFETALQAMFVEARLARHEFLTVEHLLFGLIDEPSAANVLNALARNVEELRKSLSTFIRENTPTIRGTDEVDTQPTLGFQRVIQRAIMHARATSPRVQVDGARTLVALWGEKDSHAVYYLRQQGITRLDIVNFISHGIVPDKVPPVLETSTEPSTVKTMDELAQEVGPRPTRTIGKAFETSLQMMFAEARQLRHEFITIEHMLLALIDEPSAAKVLQALSNGVQGLRGSLSTFIRENTPTIAGTEEVDTQPTLGFQRVVQRAMMSRVYLDSHEVTGLDALLALYPEKGSHAVYCLHQAGITRSDVLKYIEAARDTASRPPDNLPAEPDSLPLDADIDLDVILRSAQDLAASRRQTIMGVEHLLLAALDEPSMVRLLGECAVDLNRLRWELDQSLATKRPSSIHRPTARSSATLDRVVSRAHGTTTPRHAHVVSSADLLLAILEETRSEAKRLLRNGGLTTAMLARFTKRQDLEEIDGDDEQSSTETARWQPVLDAASREAIRRALDEGQRRRLHSYGIELLLWGLLTDGSVENFLQARQFDVEGLRATMAQWIDENLGRRAEVQDGTMLSPAWLRVIQAECAELPDSHTELTPLDLLAGVLREKLSHAAFCLREQGLTLHDIADSRTSQAEPAPSAVGDLQELPLLQHGPSEFPPAFASAWGDDEYGLWAESDNSATHAASTVGLRWRWIEPGVLPDDWMQRISAPADSSPIANDRRTGQPIDGFWLTELEFDGSQTQTELLVALHLVSADSPNMALRVASPAQLAYAMLGSPSRERRANMDTENRWGLSGLEASRDSVIHQLSTNRALADVHDGRSDGGFAIDLDLRATISSFRICAAARSSTASSNAEQATRA